MTKAKTRYWAQVSFVVPPTRGWITKRVHVCDSSGTPLESHWTSVELAQAAARMVALEVLHKGWTDVTVRVLECGTDACVLECAVGEGGT
jgi:hypothetical protein